jgi:heat shock protein HslJ
MQRRESLKNTSRMLFAGASVALFLGGCGAMSGSGSQSASTPPADSMTEAEQRIDSAGGPQVTSHESQATPQLTSQGMPQGTMAAVSDPNSILGKQWDFTWIDGFDGVLPAPLPGAGFAMTQQSGRLVGVTGCNSMSSAFKIDPVAGTLSFQNLNNTQRMCGGAASDTEDAVIDAMIATDSFVLTGKTLELRSKGKPVARLTTP